MNFRGTNYDVEQQYGRSIHRERAMGNDPAPFLAYALNGEPLTKHQGAPLRLGGPFPVLDRERVERKRLEAQTRARVHGGAHRLDAGAVAGDARQEAAIGPPPVAVHDYRDVARQTREIDLSEQHLVPRAGLNYFKEIFQHGRCNGGAFNSNLIFTRPRKGQQTGVEY